MIVELGLSPCRVGQSWPGYTNTNAVMPSVVSADGGTVCFIMGQEARGCELTSVPEN